MSMDLSPGRRVVTDWSVYPYFTEKEFRCSHTGLCLMSPEYMDVISRVRQDYGRAMVASSGYRSPEHPIERGKDRPGEHTLGTCGDYLVHGRDALDLIQIALKHGINRIGVSQKGPMNKRFLHLGIGGPGFPSPALWSY